MSSYAGHIVLKLIKNFGKMYVSPNTEKSFVKWQKKRNTVMLRYALLVRSLYTARQLNRFFTVTVAASVFAFVAATGAAPALPVRAQSQPKTCG